MTFQSAVMKDLEARGLISQFTDSKALDDYIMSGNAKVYCGFDPTADCLHVGHMVPLLVLRRFQLGGVSPIALVGGATGLIGDPSFKSQERQFIELDTVKGFAEKLKTLVSSFLDFSNEDVPAKVVNNYDWLSEISLVDLLRDYGKYYTINNMIAKEAIKARLEREETGISFTEFCYTILQGIDFLHLFEKENCQLQLGGNDQWGNLVSGVDLIHKKLHKPSHAVTMPLITKADGTKFGKTEGGAVWLSAERTSVYSFYQFWMNTQDADVERYLKFFTFIPVTEIESIAKKHMEEPHKREGQRRLAQEMTALVHGEEAVMSAERITKALFGGELSELTKEDLAQIALDGMEKTEVSGEVSIVEALVNSGLAQSNRNAREHITSGAVSVNGEKVQDTDYKLSSNNGFYGKYHVLRRGKKNYHLIDWS